ncbi:NAD-dependent epimerase/dehydratase family protein [Flavobacterium sp. 270]|uniref:NAD-dependent epimerase/dehydratase family protein n=1 Tax=Flavobacterium sp. 270 TaxID=2512114 RepID=UPI001066242D|nr:NAD-dependent epimerase/dehydratase family protein [Flavobacterium sp. 270]TDW51830.1 NAD-dependent epimerase/dehydratase family protein [Flavobacterium sp. 270]
MKVIITGATGMVGEGVLLECLDNYAVKKVLMINRKPSAIKHPKLEELIVLDFMQLDRYADVLRDYDACFYCAGVSSVGMNEIKYTYVTYDTTLAFARTLSEINPNMVFNFVTGSHTDTSENGKVMWARVKGKTENDLMKLPFRGQYNFRPGFMKPFKGQQNVKTFFKIIVPLFPVLFPKKSLTLKDVGQAMINTVKEGYPKQILEIEDIKILAAL